MPSFATLGFLREGSNDIRRNHQKIIARAMSHKLSAMKDTFLSHSSKDREYLPKVIDILEDHGASVYCDLDDERMPKPPSPQTARIIRSQIDVSERLVIFLTENSKSSSWVPWELGMGDGVLTDENVAIFPASKESHDQSWAQREFLGIYRHIVWGRFDGREQWMVYDYHKHEAESLNYWCSKKRHRSWT